MSDPRLGDLDAVAAHYAARHADHGDAPEAVGWESPYAQIVSFRQMAATEGLESGVSLLDVGCGLGDFRDYLARRGVQVDYTGVDICEPLVARARERHPDARFLVRDILAEPLAERFDVVVACGTLSLRIPDQELWAARMIEAMYGLCRRAFAFTVPSAAFAREEPQSVTPDLFWYADPGAVLETCRALSRQVTLDHTTTSKGFAVYLYRGNARPVEEALAELELGQTFGPEHRAAVEYYGDLGMWEELISYLASLEPTAACLDQIGMAAFQLGDSERQIAAFTRATELDPETATYHLHLAIALTDAGRLDEARDACERAHDIAPEDRTIARRLAAIRRALGV